MTDQPTNQTANQTANTKPEDPLAAEAYALALAFGVQTLEVDIRGIKVKVREFTPDDLHPLYSWLLEIRHLFVDGEITADSRSLIEKAVSQGTGLLSLVTDGVIPADIKLPVSVIAKLVDAILEVNKDFFEVLPSLMRLFGGLPGLVGADQIVGSAPAGTVTEPDAEDTEKEMNSEPAVKQPTEFPEPALAQPDAGHSSSDGSVEAATP